MKNNKPLKLILLILIIIFLTSCKTVNKNNEVKSHPLENKKTTRQTLSISKTQPKNTIETTSPQFKKAPKKPQQQSPQPTATAQKVVYLTIDDGPSQETPKILDILEKENIKATFFVVGYNCVRYPNYLKMINEKGHLIGNHSYSHKYKDIYKSYANFVNDFNKAQNVIYKIIGQKPMFYRFPGGSLYRVTPQIEKFLAKNNIVYIDWNAVTGDSYKSHNKMTYKDILKVTFSTIGTKKEVVLLMHDSPAKKNAVEALLFIIKELKQKGYIFATVDKMQKPLQFPLRIKAVPAKSTTSSSTLKKAPK